MPKETIYNHYSGHDDDAVAEGSDSRMIVGWHKDSGSVEVAVVVPDEDGTRFPANGNGGWYVALDRAGCNRAIRTLRKARDQAYGQDA